MLTCPECGEEIDEADFADDEGLDRIGKTIYCKMVDPTVPVWTVVEDGIRPFDPVKDTAN